MLSTMNRLEADPPSRQANDRFKGGGVVGDMNDQIRCAERARTTGPDPIEEAAHDDEIVPPRTESVTSPLPSSAARHAGFGNRRWRRSATRGGKDSPPPA
jgi:hypothetical protein